LPRPAETAPAADPVTQAAATCDALVVRHGRRPVDFEPVLTVNVATGALVVHKPDSWWPVWRREEKAP